MSWSGYKSRRWAAMRRSVLARDRYQCRECRRYGRVRDANTAHHVYPVEDFPELAWEPWNLISLCQSCHNAMHVRDSAALTEQGRAWQRRIGLRPEVWEGAEGATPLSPPGGG